MKFRKLIFVVALSASSAFADSKMENELKYVCQPSPTQSQTGDVFSERLIIDSLTDTQIKFSFVEDPENLYVGKRLVDKEYNLKKDEYVYYQARDIDFINLNDDGSVYDKNSVIAISKKQLNGKTGTTYVAAYSTDPTIKTPRNESFVCQRFDSRFNLKCESLEKFSPALSVNRLSGNLFLKSIKNPQSDYLDSSSGANFSAWGTLEVLIASSTQSQGQMTAIDVKGTYHEGAHMIDLSGNKKFKLKNISSDHSNFLKYALSLNGKNQILECKY